MGRILNNRYAAIDIGSNGVRLLLANFPRGSLGNEIQKDSLVRIPIRLGEDVFTSGKISKEKSDALAHAITGFHYLIKAYKPSAFRAVATSAMREASNGEKIIQQIARASKVRIEILTGKQEARTIYSAHLAMNHHDRSTYLYIDVGGGSTELIIFRNDDILDYRSFNVGTVRTLKGYDDDAVLSELNNWLLDAASRTGKLKAVGTGGNINRAMKILGQKKQTSLEFTDIKLFYNKIKNLTPEERMQKYRLKADRADVIVPALKIYMSIMKELSLKTISVPNIGLVDGLIYEMATR